MSIEAQNHVERPVSTEQTRTVKIADGASVRVEGSKVAVEGQLGSLVRDFSHMPVKISIDGDQVLLTTFMKGRRGKAILGTSAKHITNMIRGVMSRYIVKMVAVHSHFPITVKVVEGNLVVENFTGEKYPRSFALPKAVAINIDGDALEVSGLDIEKVTQVAGYIEVMTKTIGKDQRVFLDGIYTTEKGFEDELGK